MEMTLPPCRCKVGDLVQHNVFGRCLVIVVGFKTNVISETGKQYDTTEPFTFLHNTGLTYEFTGTRDALDDYHKGLFTPYFEIL